MTKEIECEYFGKIPERTELTVLSVDPPSNRKIGFNIQTYLGTECLDSENKVLTKQLYPGEIINVDYWGQIIQGTVVGIEGEYYIDFSPGNSSGLGGFLEFNKDDRHCWTVNGFFNKKCLDLFQGIKK